MKDDLEQRLGRGENCPSEMVLDRLAHGELSSGDASGVETHLSQCADCRERMDLRRKGFEAFPELDARSLRLRIEQETERRQPRGWTWPFWRAAFGAAVGLIAVIAAVIGLWPGDQEDRESVRVKGGFQLTVIRERNGQTGEVLRGDVLRPGDRLRFKVDLPEDGELMVVGAESSGALYACFPSGAGRASRQVEEGKDIELPGAIRLDESLGQEWLYLVFCPEPFDLGELRFAGPGALQTPKGCRIRSFELRKETE